MAAPSPSMIGRDVFRRNLSHPCRLCRPSPPALTTTGIKRGSMEMGPRAGRKKEERWRRNSRRPGEDERQNPRKRSKTDNSNRQPKWECEQCEQSFVCESKLTMHQQTHDPESRLEWMCEECREAFFTEPQLTEHQQTHDPERWEEWVCQECGSASFTKAELHKHQKRHVSIRRREWECEECGKAFFTKWDLTQHHRIRRPVKTMLVGPPFPSISIIMRSWSKLDRSIFGMVADMFKQRQPLAFPTLAHLIHLIQDHDESVEMLPSEVAVGCSSPSKHLDELDKDNISRAGWVHHKPSLFDPRQKS